MSAKHTQGPWETRHDGHGGIYVGDAKGRQIGFVSLRPEQEANASLIAAAPDLLAALERIADETAATWVCDVARAAIAKATGEQA